MFTFINHSEKKMGNLPLVSIKSLENTTLCWNSSMVMTCSLQNGIILLVMAFLISPYGLPMAAIWLLGKVQDLKFAIQDLVYG